MQIQKKANQVLAMSSKEIAELTGKEHKNVLADVRNMLESLGFQSAEFSAYYTDAKNRTYRCFNLPKRETLILVSGYSIQLRARIIDRWQELEQENIPQLPDFTNPAIAARAWADEVEQKMLALETVKAKDELLVAVADLNIRAGDVSIAEFAKNLAIKGLGQNNLYKWLKGRGFLQNNNQPYQQYVERGYFVMKPYEEKIKGEVKYKTMLTPRGTAWLSRVLHAEFELENV